MTEFVLADRRRDGVEHLTGQGVDPFLGGVLYRFERRLFGMDPLDRRASRGGSGRLFDGASKVVIRLIPCAGELVVGQLSVR